MATMPAPAEDEAAEAQDSAFEEATETDRPANLLEVMMAPNMVPLLEASDVSKIGSEANAEFEIDWASCEDFRKRYQAAMDAAMQVKKDKTFPWPNASNVCYPLLTQAAIQFQARAYPAIIDGSGVVKGRVLGNDPDGQKRERADRVAAFLSWQFLNDVPGWEEDTDRLLLALPIVGCMFRKTWQDPIRNQANSETINAIDFVVHKDTVSLDKAPRFTHVQRYYPHEIEAFIRSGTWAKVPYDGEDGSDPHSLVEIREQHRLIDMDGDGLPEPYVVTVTPDGAVARIVACYDADTVFVMAPPLAAPVPLSDLAKAGPDAPIQWDGLKVVRIERKEYFTKYGFIPAPDGSFYDIGFGTLTADLGATINTIINQLIDAGTLSNMQGGFISGGTKLRGGNMRFSPGEWKRVDGTSAGPLRDNIMPLQLPGPSPVLFQMLGTLEEAVKGITSVSDILSGNQDTQTAPTTALALIEQGQKVFTAIYQRIHRALGQEIKIMAGLDRDYLDEQKYFALDDNPQVVGRADFEDRDLDFIPVSDPRAINDRVKMAKAQVLMAHNGDPLVNQVEIRKREFEAAGIDNIKALLDVPQQGPPPDVVAKVGQAQATIRSLDAATAKSLIEAASEAYQLGVTLGDIQIKQQAQTMLNEAIALADSVSQQIAQAQGGNGGTGAEQPTDGPGAVPAMAGGAPDASLPGLSQGLPGSDGADVGGGTADVPGAAVAG